MILFIAYNLNKFPIFNILDIDNSAGEKKSGSTQTAKHIG